MQYDKLNAEEKYQILSSLIHCFNLNTFEKAID
jgi:hypothetical protein